MTHQCVVVCANADFEPKCFHQSVPLLPVGGRFCRISRSSQHPGQSFRFCESVLRDLFGPVRFGTAGVGVVDGVG
jgi:hypothetical protein